MNTTARHQPPDPHPSEGSGVLRARARWDSPHMLIGAFLATTALSMKSGNDLPTSLATAAILTPAIWGLSILAAALKENQR